MNSMQKHIFGNLILTFIGIMSLISFFTSCASRDSTPDSSARPFSQAYNIETTEMLLRFLTENPSTIQLSSDLGEKLQSRAIVQYFFEEYPNCWQILQSKLVENDNSYSLTSSDNGEIPNPRDVDDSYVEIRFPDEYHVTLFFYQSTVVGCQLPSD